MKRQAAIIGRTPVFARWSIRISCALREWSQIDSPESTERTLRTVREAAIAKSQNRVVSGLAIRAFDDLGGEPANQGRKVDHCSPIRAFEQRPDIVPPWPARIESCFAFFVDEVFEGHGGYESVDDQCSRCRVNQLTSEVPTFEQRIANCFGIVAKPNLSRDDGWRNLVGELAQSNTAGGLARAIGGSWNQIWNPQLWSEYSLSQWREYFAAIDELPGQPLYLGALLNALDVCVKYQVRLDIGLYPAGFSDGLTWQIDSHCPDCKATQETNQCGECGRQGAPSPVRKRKVMGRRPYVRFDELLSGQHHETIWSEVEKHRLNG